MAPLLRAFRVNPDVYPEPAKAVQQVILFANTIAFNQSQNDIMSAAGGTFRGTPGRGQGRGQVPVFENPGTNSPSNIPRPKLESHASSAMQSETGTSTLSASRQKQSKRDEVRA